MSLHQHHSRRVILAICALAFLSGASTAWGQTQIKKTFAVHGPATLSSIDFETGEVISVDEPTRQFVDIYFASGPNSLLAASGTELLLYPGAAGPALPVHDFKDDGMRSILSFAVDPETETVYVFAETKGKPTFKLLIGYKTAGAENAWDFSGGVIQEEFPKFVDAVALTADSPLGQGVLAADDKGLYFLPAANDYAPVLKADKKSILLLGPEKITGVSTMPDEKLALVGTDQRRLLVVDLDGIVPTYTFGPDNLLYKADDCTSSRDQIIGVAVARSAQGGNFVFVTDFACDDLKLFDSSGVLKGEKTYADPRNPAIIDGVSLDLGSCASDDGCEFATGAPVVLQSFSGPEGSAAMLHQVTGMIDCRCVERADPSKPNDCLDKGIILGPNGTLNLVDLLPQQVINLGYVPDPMLVPAWLEADLPSCELGAFIIKSPPDVVTGIVDFAWDIHTILGRGDNTRCATGLMRSESPDMDAILDWDVVGYSPTSGGTVCPDCPSSLTASTEDYEITLASNGCGSSAGSGWRFSVYLYGLSIPSTGAQTLVAVTDQLLADLGTAIDDFARPLLWDGDHQMLANRYDNALDKWTKAKDAFLNQPNAADTTLNALVSQLLNLQYENNYEVNYCEAPMTCEDTENVQGQIEVRIDTLVFLIEERLRPSVPLSGF